MSYARPTFEQIARGDHPGHDRQLARLAAMPPQRAKWFLNQLHLHGKITGDDLAYWLGALDIHPSL